MRYARDGSLTFMDWEKWTTLEPREQHQRLPEGVNLRAMAVIFGKPSQVPDESVPPSAEDHRATLEQVKEDPDLGDPNSWRFRGVTPEAREYLDGIDQPRNHSRRFVIVCTESCRFLTILRKTWSRSPHLENSGWLFCTSCATR